MKGFLLVLILAYACSCEAIVIQLGKAKDVFIINEIIRLAYACAEKQPAVYYDEGWTPKGALHDVVSYCTEHPELGFDCTLESKEDKQKELDMIWTEFVNSCKPTDAIRLSRNFHFLEQRDMTPEKLRPHLTKGLCDAYNMPLPIPKFNVRTSISVRSNGHIKHVDDL